MAWIEGGTVELGSSKKPYVPPRTVTLRNFCIDRLEVTSLEYKQWAGAEWNYRFAKPDVERYPATGVSIENARAYCGAKGKHLVTSDEWELAAAGHERRANPWKETAWPDVGLLIRVKPVGSLPEDVTPEGVFDLGGNAPEWTDGPLCLDYTPSYGPSWLVRGHGAFDPGDSSIFACSCMDADAKYPGFRCAK